MAGAGYQVGKGFTINSAVWNTCTTGTLTNNTTGGTLAAGTYYFKFTFTTANGETNANSSEQSVTTTGSTSSIGIQVGSSYWPSGATAMNVYVSTTAGQESYQGQVTTVGGSFALTSLATNGRPLPQWNTTTYQDINPSALSLATGSEFIIHNLYYNNPIAFGVWDSVNSVLSMFDGDNGNGARMGLSVHCNANQWLRVFNQSSNSTVNVNLDGMQTQ